MCLCTWYHSKSGKRWCLELPNINIDHITFYPIPGKESCAGIVLWRHCICWKSGYTLGRSIETSVSEVYIPICRLTIMFSFQSKCNCFVIYILIGLCTEVWNQKKKESKIQRNNAMMFEAKTKRNETWCKYQAHCGIVLGREWLSPRVIYFSYC